MSRRMLKVLEDVKVSYQNTVINSSGTVIQFAYGDDNYAANELIRTSKYGLQCSDISHITDMLNNEHEWNLDHPLKDEKGDIVENININDNDINDNEMVLEEYEEMEAF